MNERDPLDDLLREWKSPEPGAELDRRVVSAYRSATKLSIWRRFWSTRISMPAPVLVSAALVLFMLVIWVRSASNTRVQVPAPPATQARPPVSLADFQPVEQLRPRVVKEGQ
jgi:hypothetical protein